MNIIENEPLGRKTTMRIGGQAKYFTTLNSKEDAEEAWKFAIEKKIPLVPLGGGSNTIFADETINALVCRMEASVVTIDKNIVTVEAGKNLPMLINELAKSHLDLSSLTGILGSVGGAIFGNAGQGPQGIWINTYVVSVTVFDGVWRTLEKDECEFGYRESAFKHMSSQPLIWSVTLNIPAKPQTEVEAEIQRLLQKRIETQPHVKTAGSCFKAKDGTPAWQLIDKAGLRGLKIGGVQIAEKHANFLLNVGDAKFEDAVNIVEKVRSEIGNVDVEMRFIQETGNAIF